MWNRAGNKAKPTSETALPVFRQVNRATSKNTLRRSHAGAPMQTRCSAAQQRKRAKAGHGSANGTSASASADQQCEGTITRSHWQTVRPCGRARTAKTPRYCRCCRWRSWSDCRWRRCSREGRDGYNRWNCLASVGSRDAAALLWVTDNQNSVRLLAGEWMHQPEDSNRNEETQARSGIV